jgi:hypothetical protein
VRKNRQAARRAWIRRGQRLLVFVAEPAPAQALRLHLPPGAFTRLGPAGDEGAR